MTLYRRALLQTKEKPATQKHLLLVVTFNKNLSNIKNVIDKHWHILSINENFKKKFDKKPFVAYRRNKIYTKQSEATAFWKAKFVKIMKTTINQIEQSLQ